MFKIFNIRKCITFLSFVLIGAVIFGVLHLSSAVVSVNTEQTEPYTIYFTFDDGPSAVTEDVLNVLKQQDVKGTFFVIGSTTDKGIQLYQRIIDEGHALGLHTYSHNTPQIYDSTEAFRQDFDKLADWIMDCTNTSPSIFRFPGGSKTVHCSDKVMTDLKQSLTSEGYAIYDWNVHVNDSSAYTISQRDLVDGIINNANKKPNQDLIILLHDDGLRTTLPGALSEMIPYFKSQGYKFDVLTENTVLKGN